MIWWVINENKNATDDVEESISDRKSIKKKWFWTEKKVFM